MSLHGVFRGVADWYRGAPVGSDRPTGSKVAIIGVTYRRHWSAEVARKLVGFWMRHWQWFVGTFIAVVGLIAALIR